ncbi:MAG: arsenate reductase ArsC [Pseudomonadota bacterium]
MSSMKRILFLCTGNSCRSQMAEAWTRHLKADVLEPYSAGIEAREVDPRAVRAMAEQGIDISDHKSKHVDSLSHLEFDYVVTVCDQAHEACPFFPAKTRLFHAGFPDPPKLAENASSEEEALKHYREVRDQIRSFVEQLPERLEEDCASE